MPSIRPSRKLFLPTDTTDRSIEQLIVDDMSKIEHKAPSDIFNDAIFFRYQPEGEFAKMHFRNVYAGYSSLLEDISEVLYRNSDGSRAVFYSDYLPIVEFGLKLIRYKQMSNLLDTQCPEAKLFRKHFQEVVDLLESMNSDTDDLMSRFEHEKTVSYGRDLLKEADPEAFSTAPAHAYVHFAIQTFDEICRSRSTSLYLADIFRILGETENRREQERHRGIPPDTPELRKEWTVVLQQTTKDWTL